uniref:Uncharacterized protein n=1 Tax=viral metagenome TaxID=1070528 RepID=A0A6M3L5R6_9ZZZZ
MTSKELATAEVECLKLKKAINENHHLAQSAAAEAVERGVLTGELLLRWKELLPHGRFESFVETHFDGSLRTAQTYMQVAKELNALPKAQRTALLKQERSIAGLISHSKKGKPGGVSSSSSTSTPASSGPASGEALDSPAGGPGHGAQTQHQAADRPDAHPSAGESSNLGKCPNCGGDTWDEDFDGWACSQCHHPHGEPLRGPDLGHVHTEPEAAQEPIATILVYPDGWVAAFDEFWKQCPGSLKLVIRDQIQETTRRGSGFQSPSVSEVKAYCDERNNGIDAETFIDYYASVGWKIGNKPMKDWKAAVRTWSRKKAESGGKKNWLKEYLNRDKSKDAV